MANWNSQITLSSLLAKADIADPNNAQLQLVLDSLIELIEYYTGLDFDDDTDIEATKIIRKKALRDSNYNPKLFQIGAWQSITLAQYASYEGDDFVQLQDKAINFNRHLEGKKETNIKIEVETRFRPNYFSEYSELKITGNAGYSATVPNSIERVLIAGLEFYSSLNEGRNIKSEKDLTSSYTYGGVDTDVLSNNFIKQPGIISTLNKYKVIKNYPY